MRYLASSCISANQTKHTVKPKVRIAARALPVQPNLPYEQVFSTAEAKVMNNVLRINIPPDLVWNQFAAYMRLHGQNSFLVELEGTGYPVIVWAEFPDFQTQATGFPQTGTGISYILRSESLASGPSSTAGNIGPRNSLESRDAMMTAGARIPAETASRWLDPNIERYRAARAGAMGEVRGRARETSSGGSLETGGISDEEIEETYP
jgi:hypothetical protein